MGETSYHISPRTKQAEQCSAGADRCPYGGDHFGDRVSAQAAAEKQFASEMVAPTVSRTATEPQQPIIATSPPVDASAQRTLGENPLIRAEIEKDRQEYAAKQHTMIRTLQDETYYNIDGSSQEQQAVAAAENVRVFKGIRETLQKEARPAVLAAYIRNPHLPKPLIKETANRMLQSLVPAQRIGKAEAAAMIRESSATNIAERKRLQVRAGEFGAVGRALDGNIQERGKAAGSLYPLDPEIRNHIQKNEHSLAVLGSYLSNPQMRKENYEVAKNRFFVVTQEKMRAAHTDAERESIVSDAEAVYEKAQKLRERNAAERAQRLQNMNENTARERVKVTTDPTELFAIMKVAKSPDVRREVRQRMQKMGEAATIITKDDRHRRQHEQMISRIENAMRSGR